MVYKRILIFSLIIFTTLISYAQPEIIIKKSEFKLEDQGFKEAWAHVKEGDRCYDLGGGLFSVAVEHYKEALIYYPGFAKLHYKLGVSFLMSKQPDEAIEYLLQARELDFEMPDEIIYITGKAYHLNGDFEKALDCYNMYSDRMIMSDDFDVTVNKLIRECTTAIELSGRLTDAEIINLGPNVNSSEDDYSPVVADDGGLLYFTSRRSINDSDNPQSSDYKLDESIFVSSMGPEGWTKAGPAGKYLATSNNEGILVVDNFNQILYLYAGWEGNGDIYQSEYKKGQWYKPHDSNLGINSDSRETSVSITGSGEEIYFTSDRKKGIGGRDIYYIKKIKKNKWTKPFNLGPGINSQGHEESVWISETGDTLWFSSNGREGIGGFDIYMSIKDEMGKWSTASNLGIPINSQWNDLFYRPSGIDPYIFYFASDRSGGYGSFDIYEIRNETSDTTRAYPGEQLLYRTDSTILDRPDLLLFSR